MLILAVVLTATNVVGSIVAWVAGSRASRQFSRTARLNGPRQLLVASLVSYGFFLWEGARYTTQNVTYPGIGTLGHYPGVTAYFAAGALLAVVFLTSALFVSRRWPFLAGFLPAVVFSGHRAFVSDWLNYKVPTGGPGIVLRDDAPVTVFFVVSVGATVSLLVFVWFALSERNAA